MDISVILSSVVAISAIVAPVVTAIINNRHNMRIKKIDVFYQQKYESYKNFAQSYGRMKHFYTDGDVGVFFKIFA